MFIYPSLPSKLERDELGFSASFFSRLRHLQWLQREALRQRSNAKGRAARRVVLGIARSGRYTKEDFKILINSFFKKSG